MFAIRLFIRFKPEFFAFLEPLDAYVPRVSTVIRLTGEKGRVL